MKLIERLGDFHLRYLSAPLWLCALGAVGLYVFFATVATVSLRDAAGVTAIVGLLAVLVTLRNLRIGSELADPGGDPRIRRRRNRFRERRGF